MSELLQIRVFKIRRTNNLFFYILKIKKCLKLFFIQKKLKSEQSIFKNERSKTLKQ